MPGSCPVASLRALVGVEIPNAGTRLHNDLLDQAGRPLLRTLSR
jgi:hypothetical protein